MRRANVNKAWSAEPTGENSATGKKTSKNVTRGDLYFWSNFAGTLGVSHNAAHIGFVYTSLSLNDHRDGWLQRGGERGGLGAGGGGGVWEVKDGDRGSVCELRVPGWGL